MNKNYIFIAVGIIAVGLILAVVISSSSKVSSITLDEIIKNKNCKALQEWELEHSFDENLKISSEQMSAGMSLALKCTGKMLDNIGNASPPSQSNVEVVQDESYVEITSDNIIENSLHQYNVQITLDKDQYFFNQYIHVNVAVSPIVDGTIIIGVDDYRSKYVRDYDQDGNYTIKILAQPFWGVGMHEIKLITDEYSPYDDMVSFGDTTATVEFEIIE